jgi:quercetin dioxygenase-like cupin family protein
MAIRTITWRANLVAMAWWAATFACGGLAYAQVPGGCDTPISQRTSDVGCYLTANLDLGELPQVPLFWHLYSFPTRVAAEANKGPKGTVVESFGKIWLYVIAGESWHPINGERIAVIGPLPVRPNRKYTARYMEALFTPGMHGRPHRHSGIEAWYVLSGAQCLETPDGIMVARAGESAVVPEGPPMAISSVGPETRRAVLLVLHDTSQPWLTPASDWQPKGLCPK